MTKFILGILIGAGLAFSLLALIEVDDRKRREEIEKWRTKLP